MGFLVTDHLDVSPWVQLCGNLAPFASIMGTLSPLPTVQRIQREERVGNLPLLPYTIMIINSLLYFAYGLLLSEIRIWSGNFVGLIMGCYYFKCYLPYVPAAEDDGDAGVVKKSSPLPGTLQQHQRAIALAVAYIGINVIVAPRWFAARMIGSVATVVCVSLFASPLSVIKVVLATGNSRSIPLPFTLAMTVNCFLWTVFGVYQAEDVNISIPNGLGLMFSLAQLGLKLYFEENILHEFTREAVSRKSSERESDDAQNIQEMTQPLTAKSSTSGSTKKTAAATKSKVLQQV